MKSRFLIIFVILALSLSACVSLAEDITPPPNAEQPAPEATEAPAEEAPAEEESSPANGATLFTENCAECHGADGTGIDDAADLTDSAEMSQYPDAMLMAVIAKGNGNGMPAFGDKLTNTNISSLVTYLREIEVDTPVAESADEGEEQAETESESEADLMGKITGTVINGSGGELPEGLTIQLEGYDHDMMNGGFNQIFTIETSMQADGSYLFEDIEMPEGRAFLAIIDKDGVTHSSQPSFVTEGSAELDIPITYYESSTDASQLSIDRLHIFFEPPNIEAEIAQMVEVFVVSNPTLYVIVPEEGQAVIEFALPEGAMNVQFDDSVFGERYTETADGFGDTEPILPGMGRQEIVVFFEMPYEKAFLSGNKLNFAQKITHPIDSAIVMSPQGLKIESDLLQDSGEREAQGLIYNTYSSQPLPIGATFEMEVSGKVSTNAMSATGEETNSQQNMIYGALALGLVLIGAGAWFYMRDRNEDDDYEDDDEYDDDEIEFDDADKLMDSIIALDDAYRSGDISEEVYKKRRAALKKQLKELI
ncbi:MAG: hypothetical protein B6243_11745 [Anaerolineaceae bacterium 4572_5.2]|nr:MAG: hypothetical protein B6243_11745 [Anaerolineaceae bacterium 4572_5.2]